MLPSEARWVVRFADNHMRIAYVIGTYPQLSTTFIDREIAVLRALGVQVEILSIRRPPASSTPARGTSGVRYLLPAKWPAVLVEHARRALFSPRRYFTLLAFLLSRQHPSFASRFKTLLHFAEGVYAAGMLQGTEPGHVHAHFIDRAATVSLCISRLLGVPYSITAHANDIYVNPLLIPDKIRESAFTVTVSEFNRQQLLAAYPNLPGEKVLVLHPWVDLDVFHPPASRAPQTRLRILSVGRLVEKKGHEHLIAACGILAERKVDFGCEIIGDGPLFGRLSERVAQLQLEGRVRLEGGREASEVLARLASCDIFALPCVIAGDGDRDGMPVALAEAMAMEVPAIATDILGISEMLRPGTGFLVPPADPVALADAIEALHQAGSEGRKEMGEQARAVIARDFSLHEGVRELLRRFAQAAAEANHTANGHRVYGEVRV